jgi:DNA polymerase III sliding clamp (beta) subunit (PCNA family)
MRLLDAVNLVKSCVSNDDVVQVLSHICLDSNKTIAYNGSQAIIVDTDDIEGISCAVPGSLLINLLNSLPDSVEILQEDDQLNVSCAKTKTKVNIVVLPRKQFIFKESDVTKNEVEDYIILTDEFMVGLSRCIDTVSDDRSNIAENGVTVVANKRSIVMYSTDRIQLSSSTVAKSGKYRGVFMIPKTFCKMLLELISLVKGHKLFIGAECLVLRFNETIVFSHLVPEISYLPYKDVVLNNMDEDVELFPIPKKLSDSITRCMLVSTTDNKKVMIKTYSDKNWIEVTSTSSMGKIKERVVVKNVVLKDNMFSVNGEFFKNMLSITTDITFNAKGKNSPVIVGNNSDGFLRIISGLPSDTGERNVKNDTD